MTKVWAIMMVKDEEDIIEQVIKHTCDQGVDGILVSDNMSDDNTLAKLMALQPHYPIMIQNDGDVAYYQAEKMNRMANYVHEVCGADWILPIDADEFWYTNQPGTLADQCRREEADIMWGVVWHMVAKQDLPDINPLIRMVYRRELPEKFPVVAYRYHPDAIILQGNHGVDHPGDQSGNLFEVKHYQYRSFKQFASKVRNGKRAYDATDLPEGEGFHWRQYGAMSDEALWLEWVAMTTEEGLVFDPYE